MQVIIDLHAGEPGVFHTGKEAKKKYGIFRLNELLMRLEKDGYLIHSLYGSFLFDNKERSVIDIGEPGEIVHASIGLAMGIYETGGKLAVIFTDEKYVVFANRYFLAMHLCHMRKARALSIDKALKRYKFLFVQERKATLRMLYRRQFEEYYGLDAKPVSCFLNDHSLHRHGFAFPGPLLDNDPDADEGQE